MLQAQCEQHQPVTVSLSAQIMRLLLILLNPPGELRTNDSNYVAIQIKMKEEMDTTMKSPIVRSPIPSNLKLTGSPQDSKASRSVITSLPRGALAQNRRKRSWDRTAYFPIRTKQHPNVIAHTAIGNITNSAIAAPTSPLRCVQPRAELGL